MGIKKFIQSVGESLGLDEFKKSSKKKSVKSLVKKLNTRKEETENLLKTKLSKKEKKEKEEELKIILCQLKKGDKIIDKLSSN